MAMWNKIKKLFRLLHNDICLMTNEYVLISASVNTNYNGELYHSNWGDDLNYYFLKEISILPIILSSETLFAKHFCKKYLVIGSTIGMLCDKNTVIWGAGLIDREIPAKMKLKNIKCVRGPLTQIELAKNGYQCPQCYGDPALLLPLYYNPSNIKKAHRIGIIAHYVDIDALNHCSNLQDIHIIRTRGYKHWLDFINEVLQCECIVSSSLHGLIVAEAYGIPSQWIEFKSSVCRDHFKYNDFYSAIGKNVTPMIIDETTQKGDIEVACSRWEPRKINIDPLIKSCPFPINI